MSFWEEELIAQFDLLSLNKAFLYIICNNIGNENSLVLEDKEEVFYKAKTTNSDG